MGFKLSVQAQRCLLVGLLYIYNIHKHNFVVLCRNLCSSLMFLPCIRDAASYLCKLLEPLPPEEHTKWVEAVVDAMQKLPLASNEITKEAIHKAAQVGALSVQFYEIIDYSCM